MITWHTNGFPAEMQTWTPGWGGSLSRTSRLTVLVWSITPLRSGSPGRSRRKVGGSHKLRALQATGTANFDIRLAAVDAQWHGMRGEPDPVLAFEEKVFSHLKPGTDFVLDQFPVLSARAHLYKEDPDSCIATCDVALGHADPVTATVLLGIKSGALFELGQLGQARAAVTAAFDAARQRGVEHHVGLFDALLTLGALSLETSQLDEAERLIEEALRRSERIRPPFELLASSSGRASFVLEAS